CRAVACVVKVNKMGRVATPQNIAWMAIAMQANGGVINARKDSSNALDQIRPQSAVRLAQAGRDKIVGHQKIVAVACVALNIQIGPVLKGARFAQFVNAPEYATEGEQRIIVIQVGCMTTLARVEGEA